MSNKNSHIDEEQLIDLLKSKDQKGMDILYNNYSLALFGVIHRITENKELSEDLLQDTFLKIWNNFSKYDPNKSRLFTWMLTIARNTTIDTCRTKKHQISQKIQTLDTNVNNINRLKQAHINTDQIGIKELVEQLNTKYMEVIDLLYFQGYSQSDASKHLDLPLGTVKTRIRTAIKILKQLTKEE